MNEPKQTQRRPEADQLTLDTRARHCPKCKKTPLAHFRRTGWRCFLCDKDSDFDPALRAAKVHAIMIERRIFPVPVMQGWTVWIVHQAGRFGLFTRTATAGPLPAFTERAPEPWSNFRPLRRQYPTRSPPSKTQRLGIRPTSSRTTHASQIVVARPKSKPSN